MPIAPLEYESLRSALDEQPLFEDKTWRLSPHAWPLDAAAVREIESIGKACLEFYRAIELLYLRSAEDRNLLRNQALKAPWVAEYLDRGKPEALVEHARSKRSRGAVPTVIRPDLLLTDDGFALTEIDSVPGGIGLTACLSNHFATAAGTAEPEEGAPLAARIERILGADSTMVDAFYESLAALVPDIRSPLIAIVVSDEAQTYRPEMEWLAAQLQRKGLRVYCLHPSEVIPLGKTICCPVDGNPEKIDVIYRFWELFDLANVPIAEFILEAWEESELVVTPPMRHFQEEKLNLALFHHHRLQDFWRENLSKRSFRLLSRVIPKSWIMDPVDLPPGAILDGPPAGGRPLGSWEQLSEASQKERNLIIKMSGFHENAWGARSVILGSDGSREEWDEGIQQALRLSRHTLHVLQEYRKPRRLRHPVYRSSDEVGPMEGRLRLCPYYFVQGDEARFTGALATFCPADKKIIHGMRDAALLPSGLVAE